MRDQLLGYLLDDLPPEERAEVEQALAEDPELATELEHLRECLEASQSEERPVKPPTCLASRTCSFVEHAVRKSQLLGRRAEPATSLSESREGLAAPRSWSYTDLAAAACVLVALGALLLPAVRESRDSARRLQCQQHMFRLGTALTEFHDRFRRGLPRVQPSQNAGVFVVDLLESGILTREELAELVVCPSTPLADRVASGCVQIYIPTREEYTTAAGAHATLLRKLMAGDMAYNLGYRTPSGTLRQIRFTRATHLPLLSDAPSLAIAGYQRANHGGCGQNVLFQDLSCRFSRQTQAQIDSGHWYLNDEGRPTAGLHEADVVLAPSDAVPVLEVTTR